MSTSANSDEPTGDVLPDRKPGQKRDGMSGSYDKFFALSGGILRAGPSARTSNRFEGLLGQMVSHPAAGTYSRDVERNLDFLHISLQLDMLTMIAQGGDDAPDSSAASRREPLAEF